MSIDLALHKAHLALVCITTVRCVAIRTFSGMIVLPFEHMILEVLSVGKLLIRQSSTLILLELLDNFVGLLLQLGMLDASHGGCVEVFGHDQLVHLLSDRGNLTRCTLLVYIRSHIR